MKAKAKLKINCLKTKYTRIQIIVMFLLLCLFSGVVQARNEIPENLIESKETKINEIMLKAGTGITLTREYVTGTESIKLNWTNIEAGTKYNIYQSKEGENERIIATMTNTSVTLNRNNVGIKDESAPTMPQVTATQSSDGLGNSLTISPSTDKGTTYRHRVEKKISEDETSADVIFLIDLSGTMENMRDIFKAEDGPILTISRKLIENKMEIATMIMASSESGMIVTPFTKDINQIKGYINNFENRNNHKFALGLNGAMNKFKTEGKSKNKIVILFSDADSDLSDESIEAKKEALEEMKKQGIYLYTIYRESNVNDSWFIKDYSKNFILQPNDDKNKQVEAFNKIFDYILFDLKQNSNIVSTTVTTGVKGYQYAITTTSTHTFTNEKIVSLSEIPTYISGEEKMAQYLHIRAIDNSGNASTTNSILLQVPPKITLKSTYQYGMNYVPLEWTINDQRAGYVYRLYQREEGEETFKQIKSSNSQELIREQGTRSLKYTTPGTYTWTVPEGVTQVRVAAVGGGAGGLTVQDGGYHSKPSSAGPNGYSATAGSGGDSRFGNFVAKGGMGASARVRLYDFREANQPSASSPNGRLGEVVSARNFDRPGYTCWANPKNPVKGATGFALGFTMQNGSYGAGGDSGHYFDSDQTNDQVGIGGNSGAYNVGYVNVTPGQNVQIVVGAGGRGAMSKQDWEYGRYDVTNGTSGYVYIEYTYSLKEDVLNTNETKDLSSTDKVAPAILELFLNGIKGDKTKYEIGMVSEDYGNTYEHYVTGINTNIGTKVTSNIVKTDVITGIAGYSWKINNSETSEPDLTIGYDNDNNSTKTFPKTIATTYLDKGYYLHVKPVDNAGNWGKTVHLKLETTTITLTSHYNEYADSRGYGPNYVPLTWTNSNPNDKFFYKLFQKNEDKSDWAQVSTNYGKAVRVLNVYPNVGNQLKGWMENWNSEEPNGYGKGLITVDEVRITDFNRNSTSYLIENGEYKYDVIMFGSWDCNNNYDISWSAALATEEFIKSGRGVLFGHDTICDYGGMGHNNFNYLAKYIKATPTRNVARVGSSTVKVIKKGFLTKYPYDIETRNLTVPYCHTSGVLVYSDIWMKFLDLGGPLTDGPDIGYNNYYLASWNNCAFIRTGHSNGAATPDEQKILANVLFYLGQVTDDTYANVYTAEDLAAPEISNIKISDNKQQNRLEFAIEGIDYGTSYDHYVTAMKLLTAGTYYSNTVHTIVKTGIAKFQYTINDSKTEYSGTEYEVQAIDKEKCSINIDKSYLGKYLHIRAVDNAGNVGKVTNVHLDGAQTISREEKDATKELYCIEEDVLIPAEYDGTQQDATVEINGKRETLRWPLDIQKIFELYKEDGVALRNPYTTSGQNGFVDKSNSLGRYLVSSVPGTQIGKEGNASESYAYILSHYNDNTIGDSESQNALYEIIAEQEGKSGNLSRRNTLYYEAKEYEKFRELLKQKGGFFTKQITHNVKVGYNMENTQFIIGPFEVDYVRNYSKITDGQGNTKKVEFSGIGVVNGVNIINKNGIRIYDQDGKEIAQNTWSIEYDNKSEKEKTRGETYSEYEMPLPGEEFYIKLNKMQNENVTKISKIEVEYYEMEADAQYRILSGIYNTVQWIAGSKANKCEGGTMCPHNRQEPHTIGHTYYVEADKADVDIASQKLLEIDWAKRAYKKHVQKLTLTVDKGTNNDKDPDGDGDNGGKTEDEIRLTMNFSGNIWNDKNENISNGLRETTELGVKGVEVFLIDVYTNKQVDYTVTNENGEYIFEKVPVGIYYIIYTYDGQTYKTTKSFVNGTVEDYRKNGNGKAYSNVSIVDETETARDNLNNKFYEIKEGEAIGKDGKRTRLAYKENATTSEVITREAGTEKAYQDFQISVDTKQKDIYFPATNTIVINGIPYLIIDDNNNINVGLSERERTDENLRLDVYQTIFSIKGQRQTFLHNGKEIRDINSNKIVSEYIQKVNPDDYAWRLTQYKDKVSEETYKEIEEIYGNAKNCELEAYVEYMIILRNSGQNDTAYITELVDYYDKTLEYRDEYRDFDISSWIVIRNDDDTESEYSGNNAKEQIKWTTNSRYGDEIEYSDKFNKMYANLENYGIKKGQYAEVHIIFRVLKDNNDNIILDQNEGKQNSAEINGYRTIETKTGKIAGLIDIDSKPGDLNPTQDVGVYEDDEDKAPNYKLQLGYTNGNNGGNSGNGDGSDGGDNSGNGDNIETDQNGNIIGFGNTIEGNVWEDLRKNVNEQYLLTLDNNQVIGDAIKQENEPLINDVKVELIEKIVGTDRNGNYKEIEVNLGEKAVLAGKETRTGNELLLTEKSKSEGAYRFSHLSSGKYKIRFTYGEAKQLEKNIKYNGQDYQGISSAKIYDSEGIQNKYEETEIMLVLDNSNSMSNIKMEHSKQIARNLVETLKNKLPGVKIGLVNFNENANLVSNPQSNNNKLVNSINGLSTGGETAIGRGIAQGLNGFGNSKTKLMILITDGQETVEQEEVVIKQIEQVRNANIKLTTILTSESTNIFGTENAPRYGSLYKIEDAENINNTITSKIYEDIIKQSEVEENRSLARDLEGNVDGTEEGTRRWQINQYSDMNYKKANIIDIERISEIADETERNKRIAELAKTTYMISESNEVEFSANNVGADKIHEVNQALLERPKAALELTQEIAGIKVTLSDGRVIINTAEGLSKNVLGLDLPDPNSTISVYMDEEIMQGATIEVTYRLNLENVGEIDKLSNYFEGESNNTIPTTAKVIYAYINQNVVYREDSQTGDASWNVVTIKDNKDELENELSPETREDLKNATIQNGTKLLLRTDALTEKALYPAKSKEVQEGGESAKSSIISTDLILSRLISPEDEESTNLTYTCSMEVTIRGNDAGRRVIGSIPGNHRLEEKGTVISLEPDEARSRRIVITKPLGENKDRSYVLLALAGTSILAIGIAIIGKKRK